MAARPEPVTVILTVVEPPVAALLQGGPGPPCRPGPEDPGGVQFVDQFRLATEPTREFGAPPPVLVDKLHPPPSAGAEHGPSPLRPPVPCA